MSPILSNIYLHKLDEFVEQVLIPEYTRGARRGLNPAYQEVSGRLAKARRRGDRADARKLTQQLRTMPSSDQNDPGYRRLHYIRYADDHLLGFIGPKAEAEEIKRRLAGFLRTELNLELSQEKTLITHARTGRARFLGYEITVQHSATKITRGHRSINGAIALRVPPDVIKAKCKPYLARGKPAMQPGLLNGSDYTIVATYGAVFRGVAQYYLLAVNAHRLQRLEWVMSGSMLRTLARKHHGTAAKMARKHGVKVETPYGLRSCYEARIERPGRKPLVARFGGIPLRRQRNAVIIDRLPTRIDYPQRELIKRLLADKCELCETVGEVEAHHIRSLAGLARLGQEVHEWQKTMARRRRKTLVVCGPCHGRIHLGEPQPQYSCTGSWRAG